MPKTQIANLVEKLIQFREKRDWKKFHTPLNLAISLQLEVAELLEHFQWQSNNEFLQNYKNPEKKQAVKEEVADIFAYLLLLSKELDIDLEEALLQKIGQNDAKYPVSKSKGNATKYTKLK